MLHLKWSAEPKLDSCVESQFGSPTVVGQPVVSGSAPPPTARRLMTGLLACGSSPLAPFPSEMPLSGLLASGSPHTVAGAAPDWTLAHQAKIAPVFPPVPRTMPGPRTLAGHHQQAVYRENITVIQEQRRMYRPQCGFPSAQCRQFPPAPDPLRPDISADRTTGRHPPACPYRAHPPASRSWPG